MLRIQALRSFLLGLLWLEVVSATCEIQPDENGLVIIPDGTEMVVNSAYIGCKELKALNLPSSLTMIGDYAFAESGLESFDTGLEGTIQIIGNHAFYKCASLKDVSVFSFSQVTVGTYAFAESSVEDISFYNVEMAGAYLFTSCLHIGNVVFAGTTTELGKGAFQGAIISGDVTLTGVAIFDYAFHSATIGGNVIHNHTSSGDIGDYAFQKATIKGYVSTCNMSECTLSTTTFAIGKYAFESARDFCSCTDFAGERSRLANAKAAADRICSQWRE